MHAGRKSDDRPRNDSKARNLAAGGGNASKNVDELSVCFF